MKDIVHPGCMVTYSGIIFDLINPDPNLINLRDIAHGLAYNCRWNGSVKKYYSIAEHCIRGSRQFLNNQDKLSFLFHDVEEAYWGDMISPLKKLMEINYPFILLKMEDLRWMIYDKFGVVKKNFDYIDYNEAIWEYEVLINGKDDFKTMKPKQAERKFIELFNRYHK